MGSHYGTYSRRYGRRPSQIQVADNTDRVETFGGVIVMCLITDRLCTLKADQQTPPAKQPIPPPARLMEGERIVFTHEVEPASFLTNFNVKDLQQPRRFPSQSSFRDNGGSNPPCSASQYAISAFSSEAHRRRFTPASKGISHRRSLLHGRIVAIGSPAGIVSF